MKLKVTQWKGEIPGKCLAKFSSSQPHTSYAAFIHGVQSHWSFVQHTVNGIIDLMQPLEDCISNRLIPAITGRPSISDLERDLLSLPARMGGMDISYPTESDCSFSASVKTTSFLADKIIRQDANSPLGMDDIIHCKSEVKHLKYAKNEKKLPEILQRLPTNQTRLLDCALEKNASSLVTAIPLDDHVFLLHKGDFRDAICLRYGWSIQNLPALCDCGSHLCLSQGRLPFFTPQRDKRLLLCSTRCVTTLALNLVCNHSMMSSSTMLQPSEMTKQDLTLRPQVSGGGVRIHFLMLGFSTPAHHPITKNPLRVFIVYMRMRRREVIPSV